MIIDKPTEKYGIIYSDPPWPQQKGNRRNSRPNQGKELDYQTMSLDDIRSYHQSILGNNTEEQHNVFMWTIDKFLHDTERMMMDLGYVLHARLIWDKTNGVAPAFTVRFGHEYLLWFYIRGHMLMPQRESRGKYLTVFREQATIHSKKPVAAYEIIEDMFPDAAKLELFARYERSGWDCMGNELASVE